MEKLVERIMPQIFPSESENMKFPDLTQNCGLFNIGKMMEICPQTTSCFEAKAVLN